MSYAAQLADIKATVKEVANIGLVYERPRYGDAHDLWVTTIGGVELIRAWEIGQSGDTVTNRVTQGYRTRHRPWRVQGYVGPVDIDDTYEEAHLAGLVTAGYTAALTLADSIVDAIEADRTLGGTCLDIASPGDDILGCRVTEPTVLAVFGPLCWGVGIEFWTWEHTA